jgi:hypothetical protein
MQDGTGAFYYPVPADKRFRMYVRESDGIVEFRLHNDDDPELWKRHGWITYEMARKAAEMYRERGSASSGRSPLQLYDFEAAVRALQDQESGGR